MAKSAAAGRAAAGGRAKRIPQATSGLAHEFDDRSAPNGNSSADPITPAPAATPKSAPTKKAAPAGGGPPPAPRSAPSRGGGGVVDDGATVILVLITWAYFVLPFIVGGKSRVKAVLMAKFLNRAPDGSFLP